jgi:polyhydroxyalkanoate synthase subunit PhaE
MGEALIKTYSATQQAEKGFSQWGDTLSQGLKAMQSQVCAGLGSTTDPWGGFAKMWGLPADAWKRLSSACSMMPGDMEKAFRDIGGLQGPGASSRAGDWLSTPTLGYTRESQAEMQRLGQLWLEHAQTAQAYAEVLARVVARAAGLLQEKLRAQAAEGESLDTLRACYDLWVDCGEEAYAELSVSEEFADAQAKLTNSLMAVKQQEQKMVDETLGALNMPTRRELDTSHRRLHQLQRQVWQMQQALDDAGVRELREEVASLQRQLSAMSAATPPTTNPSSTPVRRSATPKSAT